MVAETVKRGGEEMGEVSIDAILARKYLEKKQKFPNLIDDLHDHSEADPSVLLYEVGASDSLRVELPRYSLDGPRGAGCGVVLSSGEDFQGVIQGRVRAESNDFSTHLLLRINFSLTFNIFPHPRNVPLVLECDVQPRRRRRCLTVLHAPT